LNLLDLLPPGIDPESLIVGLSGASAMVTLLAVWFALLHRDPGIQRAQALAAQRDKLRAGLMALPQRRRPERTQSVNFMRRVVERFQLMKTGQSEKLTIKLARAGMRSKDAMVRYLFFKLALPFVFGGAALVFIYLLNIWNMEPPQQAIACIGAVIVGAYFPEVMIKNITSKRMEKIRRSLPDALDLMVICAEAGLSLDATLTRVAEEMGAAQPEMSDELGLTAVELSFLPERAKAFNNLGQRVDLTAMRGLCNTLLQSERYGTPLTHSLRVLSKEMRDERILKAEEKAARLPALLTVPMIIFILPPLFVVLLGPAGLDIADAFSSM